MKEIRLDTFNGGTMSIQKLRRDCPLLEEEARIWGRKVEYPDELCFFFDSPYYLEKRERKIRKRG